MIVKASDSANGRMRMVNGVKFAAAEPRTSIRRAVGSRSPPKEDPISYLGVCNGLLLLANFVQTLMQVRSFLASSPGNVATVGERPGGAGPSQGVGD